MSSARPELIGREPVVAVLNASDTGVVTGVAGSGLTSILAAVGHTALARGGCVVTGRPANRAYAPPLSYLSRLRTRVPDRSGSTACLRADPSMDISAQAGTVHLEDLPWFVERLARAISQVAAGRPVTLLLDDLDAADALSLSVLPQLQTRLRARLISTGRAPAAGVHPRTHFRALVERLPRPSRVHLSGLDDDDCLLIARRRVQAATPGLLRAIQPALGIGRGLPGLVLGVLDHLLATRQLVSVHSGLVAVNGADVRLPAQHPLVRELTCRPGQAAAILAAAQVAGGLRLSDLDPLAAALGISGDRVAETVDALTAEGLLTHADSRWLSGLPALADALAARALPSAVPVVLAAHAFRPDPNPGEQRATALHRLVEMAERSGPALPRLLDGLIGGALSSYGSPPMSAPGAPGGLVPSPHCSPGCSPPSRMVWSSSWGGRRRSPCRRRSHRW